MWFDLAQGSAKSVIIVGAGGNIGSHLGPHLVRLADLEQITLIDPDIYQEKNFFSQDITPRNLGRPKATVQAQRLHRINPNVRVHAMQDFIENVPLGKLQADLILACLDSREARRYTNQVAWRLGIPWIDAGVEAEGLLARVNVYVPGPEAPCLECAWDERDYAALEQTYPCQLDQEPPHPPGADKNKHHNRGMAERDFTPSLTLPRQRGRENRNLTLPQENKSLPPQVRMGMQAVTTAPTNAPSSLGALAASLQALEAQKFLAGHLDRVAVGQQILIDASFHQHYVTTFRRNPQCRFDHAIWPIKKVGCQPGALTL